MGWSAVSNPICWLYWYDSGFLCHTCAPNPLVHQFCPIKLSKFIVWTSLKCQSRGKISIFRESNQGLLHVLELPIPTALAQGGDDAARAELDKKYGRTPSAHILHNRWWTWWQWPQWCCRPPNIFTLNESLKVAKSSQLYAKIIAVASHGGLLIFAGAFLGFVGFRWFRVVFL